MARRICIYFLIAITIALSTYVSAEDSSLNFCNDCVCGVNRQGKIVNGTTSNYAEFPWAVKIQFNWKLTGTGSMITARHILSAAHVFYGREEDIEYFTVFPANQIEYTLKAITLHSEYKKQYRNDIAIVELKNPVPLGREVRTICLPNSPTFDYYGKTGVAIGWGMLYDKGPLSEELRKVDLPIISEEDCLGSKYGKRYHITDNMFCAGYLKGERDTCHGDSGGPLQVHSNSSGAMEIIGIVSFGRGCAQPGYPGVYTKVTNYLQWITEQLQDECVCSSPSQLARDD